MSGRTTLLLMRHGQIIQEPTGPDGSRRYVGDRDIPLDETGRAQAREAARLLGGGCGSLPLPASLPIRLPVRLAVSSDLSRSVETANLALTGLASRNPTPADSGQGDICLELSREPALREISLGQWQGMYPAEVRQQYPGQWEARGADLAGFRPPGGENFEDVAARAVPALTAIARRLAALGPASGGRADEDSAGEDRTALVVAHAGVNLAILCRLMDLPLQSALALPQDYGCLNVLVWNEEWQHMAVRAVNLLPAALGPDWARVYDIIG